MPFTGKRARGAEMREMVDTANSLTSAHRRSEFISSGALSGFNELVHDLGGDAEAALGRAGIDPAAAAGTDTLPFRAVANLLEDMAYTLGCPDFGMRLAERQKGPSAMRPLDCLIRNAPTLGKAHLSAIAHMNTYSSSIRETLEFNPDRNLFCLRFDFSADNLPLTPQLSERTLLLVQNSTVSLTAGAARAREVWFSHSSLSPRKAYRARFGTTVKFNQEFDAIFYTGDDLRQSIIGSDFDSYRTERDLIPEAVPTAATDIETIVRDFLRDNLHKLSVSRTDLAGYLGISTRTLHRKLAAAGWTFESIRDDVRRNLSIRYLARVDLSLTQVAAMLGYSELAVFSRSCQRWFSATPGTLRQALTRKGFVL